LFGSDIYTQRDTILHTDQYFYIYPQPHTDSHINVYALVYSDLHAY
jgi:hypothetical protein